MVQAVQLALGTATEQALAAADWPLILDRARAERLAALAWQSSSERIQAAAPGATAAEWRRSIQAARLIAHLHLELLVEVQSRAAAVGLTTLAVKGVGLAERAHGAWWVRPSADIDLWAPRTERRGLMMLLAELGWQRHHGEAPGEETFVRQVAGTTVFLEAHSVLLHRALAYLDPPPPVEEVLLVDGRELHFAGGPLLVSLLAAHLAQHWFAPVLWDLDLHGLWTRMTPAERDAARVAAREARMERYLEWILARVDRVRRVGEGDAASLAAFGFTETARRDAHPWWRIVRLASGPRDALRTTRDWFLPPEMRASPTVFLSRSALRLRRLAAYARSVRADPITSRERIDPPAAMEGGPATVRPSGAELIELVRISGAAGSAVWVAARGASMAPTIPAGAEVLVSPLHGRPRRGQVVFAALTDTAPVVHRVERVDGDRVMLRGDARLVPDPMVPLAQILGEVTRARVHGREWSVAWSPRIAFDVAWHRFKSTLRRTLGAAR